MRTAPVSLLLVLNAIACGPHAGDTEGSSVLAVSNAATPIVEASNPTTVTHCLYGNHVVLGLSRMGGGYINFAHAAKDASAIPCEDVKQGKIKNEVNATYGRGWQSALRDRLHTGRYNPTQAGYKDSAGAKVAGLSGSTVNVPGIGAVRHLELPQFNLPLFSDPAYDFTQFEDLYTDSFVEAGGAADKDHVRIPSLGGPDGANQDAEVRSEFDYAGDYEVWSDAVGVEGVDVFRHTFRYTYQRAPRAMLQFGKLGVREDGEPVILEGNRLDTLSAALSAGQPEDTDLSGGIMSYGLRFDRSAGYDTVFVLDDQDKLVRRSAKGEGVSYKVPGGGAFGDDQNFPAGVVGGRGLKPVRYGLMILCRCDQQGNGPAWAIYSAPNLERNRKQIVGTDASGVRYAEDRRLQTVLSGSEDGDPALPGHNVVGGVVEEQLTKLEVKTFFKGLYAPGRTGGATREAYRQEVYFLHGTPAEIAKAAKKLRSLLADQ